MKKTHCVIFVISLILFISCNYSKGVKKDLATGLNTSYNGFAVQDVYLADASGNRLGDNKIVMGSKIFVIADGVSHYAVKDGNAFPGCSIVLSDKNKKEIISLPDAFSDMVNGTPEAQATKLKASLNTGNPMVIGETYHIAVRFFDKNKAENEILADVDILMKE